MEKFKEALKHSDIVKVVLTGVGETCYSTEGISKCIEELERLARIGRAVEQATRAEIAWIYIESINKCTYPSEEEVQLLLEWAESED